MSDLPAGTDTTKRARFPIGGPREPVYAFIKQHGFRMSNWSDKHWTRADGMHLHLYGVGSKARISNGALQIADGDLATAMAQMEMEA